MFSQIFLYYDVSLPSMVVSALNPEECLDENEKSFLNNLAKGDDLRLLTEWLLYNSDND